MVHRWIETYRQWGQQSFMGRPRQFSPAFKVAVLKQIEREGLSIRQAMVRFGISSSRSIDAWRTRYDLGGVGALGPARDRPAMKKKRSPPKPLADMTPKEMAIELEYLRAENAVLKKLDALIREEQAAKLALQRKPSKD
jgi:transposase